MEAVMQLNELEREVLMKALEDYADARSMWRRPNAYPGVARELLDRIRRLPYNA